MRTGAGRQRIQTTFGYFTSASRCSLLHECMNRQTQTTHTVHAVWKGSAGRVRPMANNVGTGLMFICLWDFGRWEWRGIILGWIPVKFRGIWSYRTSNTLIFFLFSQYSNGVQKQVTCLFITPNNKFQDHSHQHRLKKLMPLKEFSKQGSDNH